MRWRVARMQSYLDGKLSEQRFVQADQCFLMECYQDEVLNQQIGVWITKSIVWTLARMHSFLYQKLSGQRVVLAENCLDVVFNKRENCLGKEFPILEICLNRVLPE